MREETNKTDSATDTERQIIRMGISPKLSRCHCEITNRDGAWFLKDNSTNGTYVNDKRISSDSEYSLYNYNPYTYVYSFISSHRA